jgi:ribosomal protein L37E
VGNQTPQLTPATNFALQPIPSWYASPTPVETDQYVTEMRQTVVAQTREWTELYCLRCGRDLEEQANYCDACGAPAKAGLRPHIGDVD